MVAVHYCALAAVMLLSVLKPLGSDLEYDIDRNLTCLVAT